MMKRMLMRKPVTKMAGLTLLETMFGVAIGALILIAAVVFYTSTKNSQNISKVVTDINSIVAATNTYIAPGGTALTNLNTANSGDSVKTLGLAGYVPQPMYDPWGGTYTGTFTASTAGSANSGVVGSTTITINSILTTDSTCAGIVQAVAGATKATATNCAVKVNL